jgi:hypothetical protein
MRVMKRIAPDGPASGDEIPLGLVRRPDGGLTGRVFRVALGDGLCECRRAWKRQQSADRSRGQKLENRLSHERPPNFGRTGLAIGETIA